MTWILEFKWALLIALEVLAWSFTALIFIARYWWESQTMFRIATIGFVVTGVLPQITLGVLNFIDTGEVGTFEVVILLLIVYGLTLGKRDAKRLDNAIKNWAGRKKAKRLDAQTEQLRDESDADRPIDNHGKTTDANL